MHYSAWQSTNMFHSGVLNWLKLFIITSLPLFQLTHQTTGGLDWMQNCEPCNCTWRSGKKTAECESQQFTEIPNKLSNDMQVIDLSNNKISALGQDEFKDANLNNLHKIYMRNCILQRVHRSALKGLFILIELDFSNNLISELDPGTFHGLIKLRNLILNNNGIEVLPNYLFAGLDSLSRVEFKNNRIKRIDTHVFGPLPMLSAIFLESNQLTTLDKEIFTRKPKLLHLSLASNPWNCSCELKEFRDFCINNRLYTAPTACNTPKHLHDKQWIDIPSDSFACRPRILGPEHKIIEVHVHNASLACQVESAPRPNVTWIYNKRPINTSDYRYRIMHAYNTSQRQPYTLSVLTSVLHISDLRAADIGVYTCLAENRGGRDTADFQLYFNNDNDGFINIHDKTVSASVSDSYANIWLIICLVATILLFLLIIVVLMIFWYCRRIKAYQKNTKIIADDLMKSKSNKTECSMLEGGSVIREMQKSLLTEVNPVEKPPRRTELDNIPAGSDEPHDMQKSLLDEKSFIYCRSVKNEDSALSNAERLQSRRTFVENSLPPDLLAFPARRPPTSPSLKSSVSNLPEHMIYGMGSSPLTSPILAQMSGHAIYDNKISTPTQNGYMTLQHPKQRNTTLITPAKQLTQKQQSPFMPAPVLYSPTSSLIIKQGYMTIPRKQRIPSWAIPNTTANTTHNTMPMSDSPNPSETSTSGNLMEPVYDNLGRRTTAGGNSMLNINKTNSNSETVVHYTMRHRPLPATPSLNTMAYKENVEQNDIQHKEAHSPSSVPTYCTAQGATKIYEPIQEQQGFANDMLYSSNENNSIISKPGELYKITKIPPRPPPKPKKKKTLTSIKGQSSTCQIFDDGDDGTEV